jgi:rhodanese-related sulfurtransferase
MNELQRTDRLLIATSIFILILVIGISTIRRPYIEYTRDLVSSSQDAQSASWLLSPAEVKTLMEQGSSGIIMVDVRNIYDFAKGHLDNAVHIPKVDLLNKENIDLFRKAAKENKTIILYGKDQLDVTGPGMILREIGFENVKVLMGGYDYMKELISGKIVTIDEYKFENQKYNYAEITRSTSGSQGVSEKAASPEMIVPVKKSKSKAEGGC